MLDQPEAHLVAVEAVRTDRRSSAQTLRERIVRRGLFRNDFGAVTCAVTRPLKTKAYAVAIERHQLAEAKLTANWSKQRQRLADEAAHQHVVAIVRIDAMASEAIDAICKQVETVSLAGDEARVLDENYTIEEIEDYPITHHAGK